MTAGEATSTQLPAGVRAMRTVSRPLRPFEEFADQMRFWGEAIGAIIPIDSLRYVAFSHFENDECGALNLLLQAAPEAVPVCGRVNALVNGDAFDRPARALADGEALSLGTRSIRWLDAPHVPHAWECGYLFEPGTRTPCGHGGGPFCFTATTSAIVCPENGGTPAMASQRPAMPPSPAKYDVTRGSSLAASMARAISPATGPPPVSSPQGFPDASLGTKNSPSTRNRDSAARMP